MWYGRVDVQMQVAKGQGVVTSIVLMSDTLDEMDWEWSGNNFGHGPSKGRVQTNYFGKGVTGTYDRGTTVDVDNPQGTTRTYTLIWKPESIEWRIDGKTVRTFYAKDADTKPGSSHQFPQTPAKLQIGIWAGGDPSNAGGRFLCKWSLLTRQRANFNLSLNTRRRHRVGRRRHRHKRGPLCSLRQKDHRPEPVFCHGLQLDRSVWQSWQRQAA